MQEHYVSFQNNAVFLTAGNLTEKTEYVWVVFHGYKQLSKFFLKKFEHLTAQEHFFVAPQGLSKFYITEDYKRVGASWLTREDRENDLNNELNYLEAVWKNLQQKPHFKDKKLILFGFSQGVAMVSRWAVYQKIAFDKIILWGGILPPELQNQDFSFMKDNRQIFTVIGDKDMFFGQEVFETQTRRAESFFGKAESLIFEGGHEVVSEVVDKIVKKFD